MLEPSKLFAGEAGDVNPDHADGIVALYRHEDLSRLLDPLFAPKQIEFWLIGARRARAPIDDFVGQGHVELTSGTHCWLGSHLARMELRIAAVELLKRILDFCATTGEKLASNNASVRNVAQLLNLLLHSLCR